MQHVNCLLGSRVVSVLEAKFLHDPTCFNFGGIEMEKLRYRCRLPRRKQTLTQLHLA
jgi:hypothetical protein